jgi:hypothetical protein
LQLMGRSRTTEVPRPNWSGSLRADRLPSSSTQRITSP